MPVNDRSKRLKALKAAAAKGPPESRLSACRALLREFPTRRPRETALAVLRTLARGSNAEVARKAKRALENARKAPRHRKATPRIAQEGVSHLPELPAWAVGIRRILYLNLTTNSLRPLAEMDATEGLYIDGFIATGGTAEQAREILEAERGAVRGRAGIGGWKALFELCRRALTPTEIRRSYYASAGLSVSDAVLWRIRDDQPLYEFAEENGAYHIRNVAKPPEGLRFAWLPSGGTPGYIE